MAKMTMNQRIINRINNQIGSDVNNLHKCSELVETLHQEFINIESKLTIKEDTIKEPSRIQSALLHCKTFGESIDIEVEKITQFSQNLNGNLQQYKTILSNVSDAVKKIDSLNHLVEYFRVLQDIVDITNALKANIDGKDDPKIVGLYLSLSGEINSSNSIIGRLEFVEAFHLKSFALRTAIYWHDVLKDKFSKEFESLLKSVKWPFLESNNAQTVNLSKDVLNNLSNLAEYLFLIKPPGDCNQSFIKISATISCAPISTPMQILLKPFRQRFLYHFSGAKQTNRLDKPEWFYTQILSWAKDTHIFVGTHFQQAAILAGYDTLNVRLHFIRGLVQFAIEKLCIDIDEISKDEHLFAHLLDETLSFEQELRAILGYPATFPSTLMVLTQDQYLTKWLLAEENFSTNKMDAMLKTGTPWEFIDPSNMDEMKIPKCADQFIRLLYAIKERYSILPEVEHQLKFLNLQLELIDSFRRRLVQLHGSTVDNVSSTKVLNAINYLNAVLKEWGESVHYLYLHTALIGTCSDEINSVFDQSIGEFEHWQNKIIQELASRGVDNIKAKTMQYRHDNWVSMSDQNINEPFLLSKSAADMFQMMATLLHNLDAELSPNIFDIVVRLIASKIDTFFIDSMIMNTKFSPGGAAQFDFDMKRNLFALFGQYARRPDLLFKRIHDACLLLMLPLGNAILLHQTLKEIENNQDKTVLHEIGVRHLSNSMTIDILARRNDLNPY